MFFDKNNQLIKFRCRLSGIDCAEKKSKDQEEVEYALKALDRFKQIVNNELVFARFHTYGDCSNPQSPKVFGKYGRLLTTLYKTKDSDHSINDQLVEEGFAYKYEGGKRAL